MTTTMPDTNSTGEALTLSLDTTAVLDIRYRLDVSDRVFSQENTLLADTHFASCPSERRAVIIDGALPETLRNQIADYVAAHAIDAEVLALPSGEARKDIDSVLKDATLFELLEEHGNELVETAFQHPHAHAVIERAIVGMHTELRDNLWERDLQRIVDYGHIFSLPIEMAVVPDLLHGEAVAIDCLFTAAIAEQRGQLSARDVERIHAVMNQVGLPTIHSMFLDTNVHRHALVESRLHRGGALNLPILEAIGACGFTQDVDDAELAAAAHRLAQLNGAI